MRSGQRTYGSSGDERPKSRLRTASAELTRRDQLTLDERRAEAVAIRSRHSLVHSRLAAKAILPGLTPFRRRRALGRARFSATGGFA